MTSVRRDYDAWHGALPEEDSAETPWHLMVRERLARTSLIAGRAVLESGCGRGGFASWVASESATPALYVASDFSPVAVRRAAGALDGCEGFVQTAADIARLPHPSERFDTVISLETVEHLPDPSVAVKELARVLKRGGRLLLTTPNYLNTMGLYRAYLRLRGRPYTEEGQPINRFTVLPRTIMWVQRAGLEILEWNSAGHYRLRKGRVPEPVSWLDRLPLVGRITGLHSLVVARKP